MAAEMNSDPPMKNSSGDMEQLEEEEAFHNAADSFSDDNVAPNPTDLDLFQEVENLAPDGRERSDDVKRSVEEAAETVVEKSSEKMKKGKRSGRKSNGKKAPAAAGMKSEDECSGGNKRRVMYSREEMVGMRFFGVVQQKRLWREIYNGLGTAAAEYASLVDHAKNPKHPPRNNNSYNHAPSVGILGGAMVAGGGTASPYNVMVQPYYPTMMNTCYSPEWPYVSYGF